MNRTSKKDFTSIKSNVRRTFQFAPPEWNLILNRIGTAWSGVHPRHRQHGGEKRIAFGGGVSSESATENMVEICRIAERAALDGTIWVLIIGVNE